MAPSPPPRHAFRDAVFLDIPYVLDSAWRHTEYRLNRLHDFVVPVDGAVQRPTARRYASLPPFVLFLGVLLYAAYGPTLGALCGVLGIKTYAYARDALGWLCLAAAVVQFGVTGKYFIGRIRKRFSKQEIAYRARQAIVYTIVGLALLAGTVPLIGLGRALHDPDAFDICRAGTPVGPAWIQLATLLASAGIAWIFARRAQSLRMRILWQGGLLVALVTLLWNLPGIPTATEAAQVPYPHLYAVVAMALASVAWLATWLIAIPFHSMTAAEREPFQQALKERELFSESRHDPTLSPRRILGGCVLGMLHEPLLFLLIPAFAVSLVPSGFLWHACVFGLLTSALLMTAANLTSRWDRMLQYLRRYFLLGTPLIATVAIVAVAAMRLGNVQYVATVLNVAPFGVLFVWTIQLYVLFWWFEYQVNSVLAAELLKIFDPRAQGDAAVIDYQPGQMFESTASRVECTNRYLVAHATGEFVTLGWFRDNQRQQPTRAFQTFGFLALLAALLGRDRPDAVHEVGRRVQLYFALVNGLLVAALLALLWHHGWGDRHNTVTAVVAAQADSATQGSADLVQILLDHGRRNEPAIVVAASGGGTRAALYTANVLQGLHAIGADKQIVLLSGVSGGGVAAAYFYSHRASLLSGARQPCDKPGITEDPWDCFFQRMTAPFIRDVLEGASEWRVQSAAPLGALLAESFERRLFADGRTRLGDAGELGLILNTTVTGHPLADAPTLAGAFRPKPDTKCNALDSPVSSLSGGRLAFTNIQAVGAFQKTRADSPDVQLPFVLVRDATVSLARAAALNANFPPVFPNARVTLNGYAPDAFGCTTRSYFVTDGGATENLGLISALLALRSALDDPRMQGRLPEIHIVLAEASAIGYDYHQDRGVGAATGDSKERLTGRLTLELLEGVETAARAIDGGSRAIVHDVALPRVFRSRGGLGTHWMFPRTVRVMNPQVFPMPSSWRQTVAQYLRRDRYWVTLDRRQMFALWRGLHDPDRDFCDRRWVAKDDPAGDFTTVSDWICGRLADGSHPLAADGQPAAWQKLKQALRRDR